MGVWVTPRVLPKPHTARRHIDSSPQQWHSRWRRGAWRNFCQGSPPLLRRVPWGRSLSRLVDQVGACWVVVCQIFFQGFPPRMVYIQGDL